MYTYIIKKLVIVSKFLDSSLKYLCCHGFVYYSTFIKFQYDDKLKKEYYEFVILYSSKELDIKQIFVNIFTKKGFFPSLIIIENNISISGTSVSFSDSIELDSNVILEETEEYRQFIIDEISKKITDWKIEIIKYLRLEQLIIFWDLLDSEAKHRIEMKSIICFTTYKKGDHLMGLINFTDYNYMSDVLYTIKASLALSPTLSSTLPLTIFSKKDCYNIFQKYESRNTVELQNLLKLKYPQIDL